MSFQPTAPEIVFDPYHFPNYTDDTLARDLTFMVYGAAVYEAVMCINVYFAICTKEQLRSRIFQSMTLAVFALVTVTVTCIVTEWHLTGDDLIMSPAEYNMGCFNILFIIVAKFGYYIAATLSIRSLFKQYKNKKILYGFYVGLAICLIANSALLGITLQTNNLLEHSTPMLYLQLLPQLADLHNIYVPVSTFSTIFEMLFANALLGSFLVTIFKDLDMELVPAMKAMIQLDDVQKALISIASSIVFAGIDHTGHYSKMTTSVIIFWLNTQNTLFLRVFYFSNAPPAKHKVVPSSRPVFTGSRTP